MGLLNWIGLGKELAKPIEAAREFYTTDKERLDAEVEYEKTMEQRGLKQLDNNKLQILSKYMFESGWQSLSGWTAGLGIFLFYIPQLIVANMIWINNCIDADKVLPFPIDPSDILNLVYLMFGFGTYHIAKKKMLG